MANHLRSEAETEDRNPRSERSLARVQAVPWLIVILLIAATTWLAWRAFFYEEYGDPVASAMLAFEKQNSLTVFSSRFEVVAESIDRRGVLNIDILESRQASVIPATVEYRVDLARMDKDRFVWDAEANTLLVILPPLKISRPNLDEGQARVFTEGTYVSRDASADLARNNSQQAEKKAAAFARNPQILNLARNAAREAVRQNLTIPLQVAGHEDIEIEVYFDGEERPD